MFAVVDILGQQFKVSENTKYYVPRLKQEPESEVTFDQVLLLSDGKETKVGSPVVKGAKVTAKVLSHLKDDKVLVGSEKVIHPVYVRYAWFNYMKPDLFNKEGLPASSFTSVGF